MPSVYEFAILLILLVVITEKSDAFGVIRQRRQLGFCSWGQAAVSACFQGRSCGLPGYTCDPNAGVGGRCCLSSGAGGGGITQRCADGTIPAAACLNGLCGAGYTCTAQNLCCRNTVVTQRCQDGTLATGTCPTGFCAAGSVCTPENLCCRITANSEWPKGLGCPEGN